MYPRLARLAAAAALLIGLTGCGSDNQTDSGHAATQSAGCTNDSTSGRDGVNLLSIPPATVTVVDAGTGDKRVAVAEPDRSSPQSVTLVTTSSVASATDSQAQTVEMPLRALFGCTDPTDLEMTLGTVTSPDSTLADQLRPAEGSSAGLAIGPGSTPISLRLVPAEDEGPEARLAIEQSLLQSLQLSVPVPTEPIGSGARWRVERTISAAVTVTQHIEATLRSWSGDAMTLDVTVEETPVNSVFMIPGSDRTLTISRFSNAGTGQITLDVGRALPESGTITMTGARELVGSDPAQPLLQQTGLSVAWR